MAGSVNKVIIMGRVGKDPEIRSTHSGMRIANFSVATSEQWRDKNSGERKESTEWHRVTVWPENTVKVIENYVHKGDLIMIEGKLETRKWTDQSGADRYSTEVVVKGFGGSITLIGQTDNSRSSSSGRLADREAGNGYDDGPAPQQPRAGDGRRGVNDLDDEIPF
jgi:single-strand DNA-binding protein